MSSKVRDFIAVLIIQLVLTIPFYTANVYGFTISNVRATKATSNSATIEWNTDNMTDGIVMYGKTQALGFKQRHDNFVTNHTITVFNGIDSDTTYFFAVESMDLAGNALTDNNSNNFYTFRTTDITPPPQVTGLRAVSATSDSVFLSWNNLSISDLSRYLIYRNRILIANTTANSFNDAGLSSGTAFSYKVSAVDSSGNEGAQSDTLIASTSGIDSAAPLISNVDALPLSDTTARITWVTDENATTIVLYGINRTDKIKSSNDLVTNHTIIIDGLVKNARHIFAAKSCDASNNCANSSGNITAGRDVTLPFINLSIPRYANRRVIDIIGTTEPFSSVTLFVNNMNLPKRSLTGNEVGISGKFIFSQIQLEQDNVIKIVMVDRSGNKNQKIFEVGIDTQDPIVQLNEIPPITSNINLTIKGFVNEQVLIKVFLDAKVNDTAVPSKITGLNATRIGQNFVELHWNESKDKDFSHYVVYREDSSPIAITKPANFNLFIDALVDSGRSYTYQVSAVNIFANEGPKSEPITATALRGGATLNLKYQEVDIFEDFRKPLMVLNGSGNFNFGIRLNKGDGSYLVKLIFEDLAENSVVMEKGVLLDTKKPDVKITSPGSGAMVFENVANDIDIIGITKPNARVHLFVDRTPFSLFNASFELTEIPPFVADEIQKIPEAELDAKCRLNVAARSACRTGADFSVTADSNGNFRFEKVDLSVAFGVAARLREVPVTDLRGTRLEEAKDTKTTALLVIATDATGQRGSATQRVRIGTCWSGNQSWDIIPLTQYQSPSFISPERLAEGTETVYFYFNYSYIGRGTNAKIKGVSLTKACSTRELLDPRFNISCQILPSGNTPRLLNPPDNTVSYSAVPISRFPGMDTFLEKDWKAFFKAVNKELTFPLKVRITYTHDTDNDGNLETETQTTCEQVTYVMDNSIIDPRKFLPDWLLFDFVDFLQSSIKSLTQLQEQVDKLLDFVAVGCVASFGLNLVLGFYRRWVAFWEEKPLLVLKKGMDAAKVLAIFTKNPLSTAENNKYKDDCMDIIDKIIAAKGSFQMRYMTDADLRKCFPASAAAWGYEANSYNWFRWSCDRVFGHASPAGWTEKKDDAELYNKITSIEGCGVDQSVRGQPLRAVRCKDVQLSGYGAKKEDFSDDDKCFEVNAEGDTTLYTLGEQVGSSNIYKINFLKVKDKARTKSSIYAIKKDETNYFTAQQKSCEELCGVKPQQSSKDVVKFADRDITLNEDPKSKVKQEIGYACTKVDACRSFNANKKIPDAKGKVHDIQYAYTAGYASKISSKDNTPCFYNGNNPEVVSDSPATREECCCINSKETAITTQYYSPGDVAVYETSSPVHELKSKPGQKAEKYEEMEWSYRYFKEKFEAKGTDGTHSEYNPNRYISGRDLPACFGQNYWFYEQFKPESTLMLDPSRDYFLGTVQCAHIAGISNRIQFIKNLMTSLSTCLIQVRTTGRGDAGACKELFTQYLCSAIWQLVRWFVDGCSPKEFTGDPNEPYPEFRGAIDSVKAFASSAYGAVTDLQQQVRSEYGNAKLNEILGTGEESVARKICLGAFGYDWEINLKNIVDAAYATPFATLVQPITRSREFLTVDPVKYAPKYEYRASWIINPGCDFERYDIYLACVGRKQLDTYPNQINCGALGAPSIGYTFTAPVNAPGLGTVVGPSTGYSQCDCINTPDEKKTLIVTGRLKQNVLEDSKAFHKVLDDNTRYDHLKFVLRPDRRIQANVKPNCFPQGYDDGVFYFPLIDRTARDIFDCRVDELSGSFICGEGGTFASRKGIAYFTEIKIDGADISNPEGLVFEAGRALPISVKVHKIGKDKCIKASLDNVVFAMEGVTINGTYEYQLATPPLTLGQRERIITDSSIQVVEKELAVTEDFTIEFKFYDMDSNRFIDFLSDEVDIDGMNDGEGRVKIQASKYYKDGEFIIDKKGAKIQVVGVTIPTNLDGSFRYFEQTDKNDPNKKIGIAQGNILIRKAQAASPTQPVQAKDLTFELVHLKETADSFDGNINNCNSNDPVLYPDKPQKRTARIRIEQKISPEELNQGPRIDEHRILPSDKVEKGKPVIISVKFTNPLQVETAEYSYTRPDGVDDTLELKKNSQSEFEGVISTETLPVAGQFKGNIVAVGKNNQKTLRKANFEVQCGESGNYGSCQDICRSDKEISTGLLCWNQKILSEVDTGQICCRT